MRPPGKEFKAIIINNQWTVNRGGALTHNRQVMQVLKTKTKENSTDHKRGVRD